MEIEEDGSKPLANRKWEAFALLVGSKSMSAAAAYRKGWPKSSKAAAETDGPALARKSQVKLRIAWLRSEASKRLGMRAGAVVMSIAEKRAFCAEVVRTPLGEVKKSSKLCQEWSETHGEHSSSTRIKMPCKLAAIRLDNDLAGEGSEAKGNEAVGSLAGLLAKIRSRP